MKDLGCFISGRIELIIAGEKTKLVTLSELLLILISIEWAQEGLTLVRGHLVLAPQILGD
jgi:hypothetical protein